MEGDRYTADVKVLEGDLVGIWDELWHHDVERDFEKAVEYLSSQFGYGWQ